MNNTDVNKGVQISVQVPAFGPFEYMPKGGTQDNSVFNFLKNHQTVFHNRCSILHTPKQCKGVLISSHPCQHCDNGHASGYDVISHGFDLCFPKDYDVKHLFIGHLHIFFGEMPLPSPLLTWHYTLN